MLPSPMSQSPQTDARVSALLGMAMQCLTRDTPTEAEAHVDQALTLDPRHPIALFLKGTLESGRARWSEAEVCFRQALATSPGQPLVCLHLAHVLRALRRPREAALLCEEALAADPGNFDLALELAKAQEECGDLAAAETKLRELLARAPTHAQAALNLADILMRCRRNGEAEAVLRESLASVPAVSSLELRSEVEHRLAISLKLQRRHREALAHLDAAIAQAADSRAIRKSRAVLLQHLQRFQEAIGVYELLLAEEPLDLETHLHLNELLYRQGQDGLFLHSYDEAMRRAPHSALLRAAKGQFLLQARRWPEARTAFESALALDSENDTALIGLARALESLGDRKGARSMHERSLATHPLHVDALVAYAAYLLRGGAAAPALELASRAVVLQSESQSALALQGLCYRALRDRREYQLNNYEAFVQVFDLAPPAGYQDMASFNHELSQYLAGVQSDVRENFTQTLRGGTRLFDELFYNGHELIDRLCVRIEGAVRQYIASLRIAPDHPFTSRKSDAYTFTGSWSSRIHTAGYHLNHIHPAGWISSAYYVEVPQVCADPVAKQGWLKFGEPTEDFGSHFAPRFMIQPRPGRLVLFPSYLWHGTTPYNAPEYRTSVAFDVSPL